MTLLLVSLLAGVLSVLAPCIISTIPLLLARTADGKRQRNPIFVIGGLLSSIFIFSLLLKSSTLLVSVPTRTWQLLSGLIIITFGIFSLFPSLWEAISGKLKLQLRAQKKSGEALKRRGILGDIILGASLGPIFSACSPTYALIVASILPAQPLTGLLYLVVFLFGLGSMLGLIAILGSRLIKKLGWGINPHGWFKRGLGILFIVLGILIATGLDKSILTHAVESGWFDWQVNLESRLDSSE